MESRAVKITVAPDYDVCVHVVCLPMSGDEQRVIVVSAHEVGDGGEYLDRDELIHLADKYTHLIIAALEQENLNESTIH